MNRKACNPLSLHYRREIQPGAVGHNGVGKSTLARLAAGILKPAAGSVITGEASTAFYCEQETASPPDCAHEFLSSTEPSSGKICSLLGIGPDWPARWGSLSYGERKRFPIGAALWSEPDIPVLDESVNHVDLCARRLTASSLIGFKGVGIVVLHDREFLNTLCRYCLFMHPGHAVFRRENFSEGFARQRLEDEARERKYSAALPEYRGVKKSGIPGAPGDREDGKAFKKTYRQTRSRRREKGRRRAAAREPRPELHQ